MISKIYWINESAIGEKRLGMMARPRGEDWLEDEIRSLSYRGIHTLVSLLDRSEARELGLAEEEALCEKYGIRFTSFPIEDMTVPQNDKAFLQLIEGLITELHNDHKVLVHCRAGIGRSSILVSCLMISFGAGPAEVFSLLSRHREVEVPDTEEQKNWVLAFAEKYLLTGRPLSS